MRTRPRRIVARYQSICPLCSKSVEPGDQVYWVPRQPPAHVNCQTAAYAHAGCTRCHGSGAITEGPYSRKCPACDGTGSKEMQERTRGTVDPMGVDTNYEDSCREDCGL